MLKQFSDNYYVSAVIAALGHALVPRESKERIAVEDTMDFEEELDQQILDNAKQEIERYRTLDYLIPTYHNTVTVSCLQVGARFSKHKSSTSVRCGRCQPCRCCYFRHPYN